MQRSKLEKNLDILEELARAQNSFPTKQLRLTHLINKSKLSENTIKEHLDFMIRQELIEERNSGKNTFFTITARGLRVLSVVVPIIEKVRKTAAVLH